MKTRIAVLAASALAAPLLLVGCGGSDDTNSGSRPSADEISAAFADQVPEGTPGAEEILDCFGRELEASELPNGVLRSLAEGEEETEIDADNEEKYDGIVDGIVETCTAEAIEAVTGEMDETGETVPGG
jgi:major membrane immunogen (membrane-anchored lipoprotein)